MNNKIVILENDKDSAEIIKSYLSEIEGVETDKLFDNYDEGATYSIEAKPHIVLLALSNDIEQSKSMIQKLSSQNINVIVLSANYTTNLVIQTLRAGAKDFLSKPLIKKDFIASINKYNNEDKKIINNSNIISIFSNKGGIGKTAIATNLAVEFARQTREKVVLVDLNLPLGDVTTFINIKPSISITSAVENATHNGAEAVLNACKQYKDTSLYVLAEPIYMEESHTMTPTHIYKLFEYLRESFTYMLVDVGTNIDKMNLKILELSDLILLVSIVNLPLIRNCQRCLDLFNNLGYDENKTKIVINRYLENDEIKTEDVEKVLNQKIYWKIPNNYFAIMSSINKAMPVCELNENSNVTLSFSGLATKLQEDIIAKDLEKNA